MCAMMDMVAMGAKSSLAATPRANRDIGAPLLGGKDSQSQMSGQPEAEGRTGEEGPG